MTKKNSYPARLLITVTRWDSELRRSIPTGDTLCWTEGPRGRYAPESWPVEQRTTKTTNRLSSVKAIYGPENVREA